MLEKLFSIQLEKQYNFSFNKLYTDADRYFEFVPVLKTLSAPLGHRAPMQ